MATSDLWRNQTLARWAPTSYKMGVTTPISRVITPVTHLFSAIYRGPITAFSTGDGAHPLEQVPIFLDKTHLLRRRLRSPAKVRWSSVCGKHVAGLIGPKRWGTCERISSIRSIKGYLQWTTVTTSNINQFENRDLGMFLRFSMYTPVMSCSWKTYYCKSRLSFQSSLGMRHFYSKGTILLEVPCFRSGLV